MQRYRPSKSDDPKPRFMIAMYNGSCRCGKRIKAGDRLYRDEFLKLNLCNGCGMSEEKQNHSQVTILIEASPIQPILDELSQLIVLPSPISSEARERLQQLQRQLVKSANADPKARYLLMKRFSRTGAQVIRLFRQSHCSTCSNVLDYNEPVYFQEENKFIWCFQCSIPQAMQAFYAR